MKEWVKIAGVVLLGVILAVIWNGLFYVVLKNY